MPRARGGDRLLTEGRAGSERPQRKSPAGYRKKALVLRAHRASTFEPDVSRLVKGDAGDDRVEGQPQDVGGPKRAGHGAEKREGPHLGAAVDSFHGGAYGPRVAADARSSDPLDDDVDGAFGLLRPPGLELASSRGGQSIPWAHIRAP